MTTTVYHVHYRTFAIGGGHVDIKIWTGEAGELVNSGSMVLPVEQWRVIRRGLLRASGRSVVFHVPPDDEMEARG